MNELDDRRVLGALEFFSAASGARLRSPLQVHGAGLELQRNAGGLYVIRQAAGLQHHGIEFFAAPDTPAAETQSFELEVRDPQRAHAARRLSLRLPRPSQATPGNTSLLEPVRVPLLPARSFRGGPDWALLHARVLRSDDHRPVANALLSLQTQVGGARSCDALTDGDGEALLCVTGVAPVLPGEGANAALSREFTAQVTVVVDSEVADPAALPDPDRIASRRTAGAAGV
ncbi:MAG TPA: hypothetical protein VLI06_16935, partial [Solimonas sp.]|nr:hypothetical protein [Solimonas sp.]